MLLQIALLGWIFLDEVPTAVQWLGLVIVFAGIALAQRRGRDASCAFVRWPPMDGRTDEQTRWSSAMEAAIEQARLGARPR